MLWVEENYVVGQKSNENGDTANDLATLRSCTWESACIRTLPELTSSYYPFC